MFSRSIHIIPCIIPFYCRIMFHCMDIPLFAYPLTNWWTFGWSLPSRSHLLFHLTLTGFPTGGQNRYNLVHHRDGNKGSGRGSDLLNVTELAALGIKVNPPGHAQSMLQSETRRMGVSSSSKESNSILRSFQLGLVGRRMNIIKDHLAL